MLDFKNRPIYLAINYHNLLTSLEARHLVLLDWINLHSSKTPQIFCSVIINVCRSCRYECIVECIYPFRCWACYVGVVIFQCWVKGVAKFAFDK